MSTRRLICNMKFGIRARIVPIMSGGALRNPRCSNSRA
jgi:hypothetical protein